MSSLRSPYTPKVLQECTLPEKDSHVVAYHIAGNPDGQPVLFLHGGPGGGTSGEDREYFDPAFYKIVLMDQRGAGKSTPAAHLENNTTWDLIDDIERLRTTLKIEKWFAVFGGSWGSTLSLVYAVKHPERISHGLVLRGIFTLRRSELEFFYQDGASHIFPEYWDDFTAAIPVVERGDYISAYHRRVTSSDPVVRAAAAKAWTTWEMATCKLFVDPASVAKGEDPAFAEKFARIETHYFVNGGFFPATAAGQDGWLLEEAGRVLPSQPFKVFIVQGRYDVVCPATTAFALKKRVPAAELAVTQTGHSSKEPAITSQLIQWMDALRDESLAGK